MRTCALEKAKGLGGGSSPDAYSVAACASTSLSNTVALVSWPDGMVQPFAGTWTGVSGVRLVLASPAGAWPGMPCMAEGKTTVGCIVRWCYACTDKVMVVTAWSKHQRTSALGKGPQLHAPQLLLGGQVSSTQLPQAHDVFAHVHGDTDSRYAETCS
jgi:hypothetical protein